MDLQRHTQVKTSGKTLTQKALALGVTARQSLIHLLHTIRANYQAYFGNTAINGSKHAHTKPNPTDGL